MQFDNLKSQKIGILGFGQEGQAVLTYLSKHNLTATVYDENPMGQWATDAQSLAKTLQAKIVAGADYLDTITDCDILFRSPGIWRKHPKILAAERNNTIITSQAKWFFENTPATIVGITGTKGKGTTSSLIHEMVQEMGRGNKAKVYLTGNIGKTQPLEFIDETAAEDVVVFELSSFQLQDLTTSPHVAVCLMVTSDHLNHHSNLEEYHQAKASITAFQTPADIAIYNADYDATVVIGQQGQGAKLAVSAQAAPERGAFISGDTIIFNGLPNALDKKVLDCANRNLRGAHNLENIAAAALAANALGVDWDVITKISQSFSGLEHRLQYVGTFNNVSYYNDSISTVPETTIAALNSFTEPTHLILGGSDKGLNYDSLVNEIASRKNIMGIILLGEVGKSLHKPLADATQTPLFGPYTDFREAIDKVQERAQAGDVVLLSPAAASFDMFKNYADRGNQFVKLVSK